MTKDRGKIDQVLLPDWEEVLRQVRHVDPDCSAGAIDRFVAEIAAANAVLEAVEPPQGSFDLRFDSLWTTDHPR
jgi:hypothetical protein